jgi:putative oxidoreductase
MFDRTHLENLSYTLLRIVSGALFSFHGMQKVLGWFTSNPGPAAFTQQWVGGVIELVCGVLIAIGLFSRPAAFLASGTMAVAYIQFHWKLEMGALLFPIVNKGELAVIYCFVFLLIAARGAGALSVDRVRGRS